MRNSWLQAAGLWLVVALAALVPSLAFGQPATSADAAFAHVQHLAGTIGPRVSGTSGERQAAEYLMTQLRQYGYPVEAHAFQFPYFEARRVEVQPVGATQPIPSQALFFSAATPADGLEADLVFVGLGRPADFDGKDVAGAVVLAERGSITFREKVANAASRGAVAAIIYNNTAGIVAGTLGQRSEIPAVTIGQDEGRRLVEAAQRGRMRVRLLVDTLFETRTASNVVASRWGLARPEEVIVAGAHFDTVPAGPGANDNASGVAATLEAARVLAGVPAARTVQFVFFAGEELGLYGSGAFAAERRGGVVAMINLDMVGWGDRLMIGASPGRDDSLVGVAERVAQRLHIPVSRFRSGASDHVSFERYGIPSVFLHRGVDPHYHQPGDVPANITPHHLDEAARLLVGLLQELAGTRPGT
ncbi:MAG: M20/M25/M40 family metallo-hydrolase [Armatimonadota bacterium]|nr:M20/M25/M40 family metallo-hydrolase [Armatimonadota bacterium]